MGAAKGLSCGAQGAAGQGAWAGRRACLGWLAGLGYEVRPAELREASWERWGLAGEEGLRATHAGHLARDPSFAVLLVEHIEGPPAGGVVAWMGRWAGRLWRRDRAFRGLLLCADVGWAELAVGVPWSGGHEERPSVRCVRVVGGAPSAMDAERLGRLEVQDGDECAESLALRLARELDVRRVARRFFEQFKEARGRLAREVEGVSCGVAAREEWALVWMGRVLFAYFLQRKGLLDGRRDFMRAQVRRVLASGGGVARRFLRPLFFEALNAPWHARSAQAKALGRLPYLNGGLFEPSALEQDHPDLDLPDGLVVEILERVFERYSFTTREDGEGAGLDPEMLGRVFEALMASQEREAQGAFYTPRDLVGLVCRRTLEALLARVGVPEVAVGALLEEGRAVPLPPEKAARALERLDRVSILDSACGSGAFLLGALLGLEALHRRLAALARRPWFEGPALRRRIARRNLYGVDINKAAVRLCELRLWLAMLDASPDGAEVEPLPNLDLRVLQGDALREPAREPSAARALLAGCAEEAEELHARYGVAVGEEKRFLRVKVERLQRACREVLRDGPQEDEELSPWVCWPEVMARGGFDAVLMNPPWVRLHNLSHEARGRLRGRYEALREGEWRSGGAARVPKGLGSQVDLSACFVERALELLDEGGVLGALLTAKLARAMYGGGARRLLMTRAEPLWLKDVGEEAFGELRAYPLALVARKGRPSPTACVELDEPTGARRVPLWRLRLDPSDPASPWVWSSLEPQAAGGLRVGDCGHLAVKLGVKTCLNAAFLREGPPSEPWELPALRGADVRAWRCEPKTSLRWTHDRAQGKPLGALPDGLTAALMPYRGALAARREAGGCWWRLMRVHPGVFGPKVVWRDLGRRLEAVALAGGEAVPLNSTYFIPLARVEQAQLLAAWFNAGPVRRWAAAISEPARDGFRRFLGWVVASLPMPRALALALEPDASAWPRALDAAPALGELWALSAALHGARREPTEEEQRLLDALAARLMAAP